MLVLYVCFVPGMASIDALWNVLSEIMVLAVLEKGHLEHTSSSFTLRFHWSLRESQHCIHVLL